MTVLGVDIGGTKIAAAQVNERAEVLRDITVPTLAGEGFASSYRQLRAAIEGVWQAGIQAIGVCAPGPLNPKTGVVLNPPNLPGWRSVPVAEDLARDFGVFCRLENDANAAGLAEALFGAARGYESVFYVTLSTGIGTGIVIGQRIYHGKNGAAGEGGHISIDPHSEVVCGCGMRGCIEALACGPAMERRARRLLPQYPESPLAGTLSGEAIAAAIGSGDPLALRVLDETADALSRWLGSMVTLLDPDIVVIGGGVSRIGNPLFDRLRAEMPKYSINQFAGQTPIVPAQLARHVGVIGASAAVLRDFSNESGPVRAVS